uniref:Uncharacterized protein n=1 Tax=Chromera velia CCMP2878 TaxID=1169474 RepID=A0A0G4FKJ7_9ALVE|eukprot:Cvel_17500.t1-p1 / transcript=Cvel_17500.t1 / gene=Cvel_17500 / organism=Chromera_velia_CCMP2878 / gene_product=hypothetical protein / transcript_product=hypothetical protein / location=Cvel_scaffold1401:7164-7700(+) / protein_length=179 / sequence_SO=supercontig / SO=protein_coding / is_pseudo=false
MARSPVEYLSKWGKHSSGRRVEMERIRRERGSVCVSAEVPLESVLPSGSSIAATPEGDPAVLLMLAVTSVLSVVAWRIWDQEIVPQKRAELARSKRDGEVRSYLDQLETAEGGERSVERWFFSDWLSRDKGDEKKKKPAAVPFLKKAKWNSGDNPLVVTTGVTLLTIAVSTLAKEIGGK